MIFKAARIADGALTVIFRGDFLIGEFCNRMWGSHGLYSLLIGIVMSELAVLPHDQLALNNTCKSKHILNLLQTVNLMKQ